MHFLLFCKQVSNIIDVKASANLISAENANQNNEKMIWTFIWERHLSEQHYVVWRLNYLERMKFSQQKASLKMPQLLK